MKHTLTKRIFSEHHKLNTGPAKVRYYHAEINEQNSGENWSEGAQGGGCSTMALISSKKLSHASLWSGGVYGNFPVAHSSSTNPKLQMSLL